MLDATVSGCINHPDRQAIARCRQCGRPLCSDCRIEGPTGDFCSIACQEKHEQFVNRAQHMKVSAPGPSFSVLLKRFIIKLLLLLALILLMAGIAVSCDLPVLNDLVHKAIAALRVYLPFI